ncbi:unnamed protein product [Ceratitis capitata]|uniref:(Mediterranean fruit fly) hypothetical protein n=1 Tax=Ceratitis capitata TaxID=7213 RepID=A0A811V5G3_CERCA|nr:unnamed protein product [Ceratitis capitata]
MLQSSPIHGCRNNGGEKATWLIPVQSLKNSNVLHALPTKLTKPSQSNLHSTNDRAASTLSSSGSDIMLSAKFAMDS